MLLHNIWCQCAPVHRCNGVLSFDVIGLHTFLPNYNICYSQSAQADGPIHVHKGICKPSPLKGEEVLIKLSFPQRSVQTWNGLEGDVVVAGCVM